MMHKQWKHWMQTIRAQEATRESLDDLILELGDTLMSYWRSAASRVPAMTVDALYVAMPTLVAVDLKPWQEQIKTMLLLLSPGPHQLLGTTLEQLVDGYPMPKRVAYWARLNHIPTTALTILQVQVLEQMATLIQLQRKRTMDGWKKLHRADSRGRSWMNSQ